MTDLQQRILDSVMAIGIAAACVALLLILTGCAGTGDKYKNTGLFCEKLMYMGVMSDTKIFNLDQGVMPKSDSFTVTIPPEGCSATITTTKTTKP